MSKTADRRKVQGLCVDCGVVPPDEGRVRCGPCRSKFAAYIREKKDRLAAEGRCKKCGVSLPENYPYKKCEECLSYERSYIRAWHERNRSPIRLQKLQTRFQCIEYYGGVCACCGLDDLHFLTIDHINNDGAEHRRTAGVGNSIYPWLIRENFPEGLQVLCMNCNAAKHWYKVQGGCPHQWVA